MAAYKVPLPIIAITIFLMVLFLASDTQKEPYMIGHATAGNIAGPEITGLDDYWAYYDSELHAEQERELLERAARRHRDKVEGYEQHPPGYPYGSVPECPYGAPGFHCPFPSSGYERKDSIGAHEMAALHNQF